ncbi:PAS domain-containing sensor histidine kinase [Brevibacillus reuszeri]|uniref:PAS domain-containing sensor histidine kinase n=1 Tax=Brevibacillus reuszeri TaxID=54915 RepID=UPI003D24212C
MKQVCSDSFDSVLLILVGWIPIQTIMLALSPARAELHYFIFSQLLFTFFVVFLIKRLLTNFQRRKLLALEEKKTEQSANNQLKSSEIMDAFLQQLPDPVAIMDIEGNLVRMNQSFSKLVGCENEKLISRSFPSEPGEMFDLTPLLNEEKNVIGMVWRLRSVEKQPVEHNIDEAHANFRLITENMTDMVFVYGPNGTPKYISASLAMLLGYTADEIMQMEERSKLLHPEDLERVQKVYLNSWTKESVTTTTYRMLHREGRWIHVESRYKPIRDHDGKVESIMILSRDVTELMLAKELLRQSDKLSALGQLAAGIAHEIRNPLTSLRGFVQLLQSSLDNNQKRYCEIMLSELDRINFIVSELLVLAKPQGVKFQQKDLAKIVEDVLSFLDSQANLNNIQIHTSIHSQLPLISCEENQLKQVFLNICKNAIEAMPEGGEIYVQVAQDSESEVSVRIRDTGCGIESAHIPRVGEPFYTTKENGTGLGLMISSRILEDHGGSIHIESQRQQGTTVSVLLPISRYT